jgi:hypothetical protein
MQTEPARKTIGGSFWKQVVTCDRSKSIKMVP